MTRTQPGYDAPRGGLWAIALTMAALTLLALAPRLIATGEFVTPDEGAGWFVRSERFLAALRAGAYADTILVGHPGVTTLWLGAVGHLLHERAVGAGLVAPDDYVALMRLLRLPAGAVGAICVGLAYPMLLRLFGRPAALLAGVLWATSPFLVAHAQVLHLDMLQASFMALALLAGLVAFRFDEPAPAAGPRLFMLLASAFAGGLALLTKSPAVLLAPMLGLIALAGSWRRHAGGGLDRWVAAARASLLPLAAWTLVAALTWVALWPAAWVDAPAAVSRVVAEVLDNGAQPHENGNFFLGRAVADPGPLFYPVAVAFRLTPWTMAGLVLAAFALARGALPSSQRAALALLLACAALYLLALTAMAKKFDRYALPIWPALEIAAAVGYAWAAQAAARRFGRPARLTLGLTGGALLAAGVATLAWYRPYELTYFNPLLGGGAVAERVIPVSWGEGYELAAAYIMGRPDGCDRPVAVWIPSMMGQYSCRNLIRLNALEAPDHTVGYAMLYRDMIQRGLYPQVVAELYGRREPVYVARVHGIEMAYVYQFPRPIARLVEADFGSAIHLRGYDLTVDRRPEGGQATLTLQWQARGPIGENYSLFIHLIDAQGRLVSQVDVPPAPTPTTAWEPQIYFEHVQALPLPAAPAPGRYWLAVGLYSPDTLARLPLSGPPPPEGAPVYGPDALLLGPLEIE